MQGKAVLPETLHHEVVMRRDVSGWRRSVSGMRSASGSSVGVDHDNRLRLRRLQVLLVVGTCDLSGVLRLRDVRHSWLIRNCLLLPARVLRLVHGTHVGVSLLLLLLLLCHLHVRVVGHVVADRISGLRRGGCP